MRTLGHSFVEHALSDDQLDTLSRQLREVHQPFSDAPVRVREFVRTETPITIPTIEEIGTRQLFADSFVSGTANPMGLAAQLWREGDTACMQVTLGKAFEGAPGRAHGGVVAAILDEVMGSVNAVHGTLAYTVQLDITYQAPTPFGEPIIARAWLARQDG